MRYNVSMEKNTPHCKLRIVKELVRAGLIRLTNAAAFGARELGLDSRGVVDVVLALEPRDFYKSMTTYADHRIWQDVYRPSTPAGDVYLKLTVIEEVGDGAGQEQRGEAAAGSVEEHQERRLIVVVSFKEL